MDENTIHYVVGAAGILAGILQMISHKALEKYAIDRGAIAADRTVKLSGIVLVIAGGLCFVEDLREYGYYALAAISFGSALILHKFWDEADRQMRVQESIQFLKSLFISAVLVAIIQVLN